MLIIKKSLKLLYSFSLGLKHKVMLFTRKGLQIYRSIVTWYSIKMVNYPSIGQGFAMCLLPNEDMLKNISSYSSRMVRFIDTNIAVSYNSATLPIMSLFSSRQIFSTLFSSCPRMFEGTVTAASSRVFNSKSSFPSIDWLAAIRAKLRYILTPVKIIALPAPQCCIATRLSAIKANMCVPFFPSLALLFRPHNTILTYCYLNVNHLEGCDK